MAKKSKEEEEEYDDEEEEEYSDVSYEEGGDEDDEEESEYDESDDEPKGHGGGAGGRKKISQLAFAVGKDVDNPKGKKKEMRRLRQFLGFAGRSVLLTLDDLPEVSYFAPRASFATYHFAHPSRSRTRCRRTSRLALPRSPRRSCLTCGQWSRGPSRLL